MYEDYFGLERPPFKITPDTSLFFEGGKRGDILAALVYAIHRGEGIIKVVGEVGSGKTMLCRMLQLRLPETVEIVYIANPSVSPDDILFVIAHELSLEVASNASKHVVMHLLQDYLLQRHMDDRQVVLFVEEAQGMPIETLEEIRLLSNLETDQNKLLQIILFGQPELDHNLAKQSIRQLRERITHSFDLEPLSQYEIYNYLNFRMRETGYTGPELIDQAVAKRVEHHSGGLLRRINIIADKILLSAFAEGTHDLGAKHVTAAVNDSTFGEEQQRNWKSLWLLGLLLLAALVYALFSTRYFWLPVQANEIAANPGNAAIIDNPVTDIQSRGVETEPLATIASEGTGTTAASESIQSDATGQAEPAAVSQPQPVASVSRQAEAPLQQAVKMEHEVESAVQRVTEAAQQVRAQQAPVIEHEVLRKALDQAASSRNTARAPVAGPDLTGDYNEWLNAKLRHSRDWLSKADSDKMSIQVLMRSKSAARELVYYLRNEWPLDLTKTYLYEVSTESRIFFRVFYSEFDSLSHGRDQIELLPESIKVNSPYLNSVHRMQKALL